MYRLDMETSLKIKASIDSIPKEVYDKMYEYYEGDMTKLEKEAKEDLKRAIISDLGFESENIDILDFKFTYTKLEDAPIEEKGAHINEG